ncbi:CDPK-related protein kinase-like isoform X2 [Rutidosis leptorrhynchoides]|uniref:CDPK-related protein kinase-like isoform X2 n=1 Tax=Rutidosis leptorrhynchoides TaxID=125765 RepID=UPI003A9A05F2
MGICSSKDGSLGKHKQDNNENAMEKSKKKNNQNVGGNKSPLYVFYAQSPTNYLFSKKSPVASPARLFKKAFAPLSPAQHMKAVLARRHGNGEEKLNKNFGFSKHIGHKYEIGEEVGKGHFGHTCKARCRKGEFKGQIVAVKIISKSKMTTAIAIEDVHREVKILRALTGHKHLINFYDAYEDHDYVYLIMELCEGGVLLERILARGGKYTEDEAKSVLIQMLTVVSFCHLQGVVHRDLKPENFLYASKDKDAELKAIDFGLSDFVCPEEKLDDIVGSAYYVAPEVLQRSYSTEADVWSVGVISYVLLCGNRPFWGRTESGIFRSVLKNEPKFDEAAWDNLSFEAKDFVKSLLNKEPRKRLTAAQALCHPWIRNRVLEFLESLCRLQYRRMDFEEFCAAAVRVHQLEGLDRWEQQTRDAYEIFEQDGNKSIVVDELASELGLGPEIPVRDVLGDLVRQSDGNLTYLGFVKVLHGPSSRNLVTIQ